MPREIAGHASLHRYARWSAGLLAVVALAFPAAAAAHSQRLTALASSVPKTSDHSTGALGNIRMSIEVVLKPAHQAKLNRLLGALYNPRSAEYHHWLAKGQFAKRFGPSAAERAAVAAYLRSEGLRILPSSSPFLVRAVGRSTRVSTAFHTSLRTYLDKRGVRYFANARAVRLPSRLAHGVISVVGLTNTVRARNFAQTIPHSATASASAKPSASSSCEGTYPTLQEWVDIYVDGAQYPYGYGAAPYCQGLSPFQTDSIYGAPNVGNRGKGAGVTMAVFELAAYRPSDIDTWAHTFYGAGYNPPLVNIPVDGGPLTPDCPAGDTCPFPPYDGDVEVVADIEQTLAVAPAVKHILVYDAPNDYTGQTELDEYNAIAQQDVADTTSSSWGECENDAGAAYAQAENQVFEQMAAQGQSIFSAAGDTGAFGCIRDGTGNRVNVGDPTAQPLVTSAGGTSFNNDNPGTNESPTYPAPGTESVWNTYNLCDVSADEYGESGYWWCTNAGAGGGGSSQFWGMPSYQRGPGVLNSYTRVGNGGGNCALAAKGTPCREVPDVSADSDPWTGYGEYCTGSSAQGSTCAQIPSENGWFLIGGTSLAAPLWSAVIGDHDGYQGARTGLANAYLYKLFNSGRSAAYFHDITGYDDAATNNGIFPTTSGYDMATGIGTPNMAGIITGS